ncbi:hypothetical protein AAFF_G00271140 [Aldrovandia affinis]|uniref:Nerve growth factor-related domain-containing protein n=1 Tax=Aldrovandia affinis TaxID=143900 RepID=A0AAD7RB05_9TELE|nr:hypothetical protein AAFF_G00271140 [Aldrovandia affinis]
MRSSTLVLLFLISVQAVQKMGGAARGGRQREDAHTHTHARSIPTVDPKLFNKRRYRSPRVLFSAQPPDSDPEPEQGAGRGRGRGRGGAGPGRVRRRASQSLHRGEYAVCDSVSNWVKNKTRATDIKGHEVTVLSEININNQIKKQLFFETTCRSATLSPSASGCRGIDSRHWNSYCTNTHTFVQALTSFNNRVAFRYIRINAACGCVLSRKSWRH